MGIVDGYLLHLSDRPLARAVGGVDDLTGAD